jgi:hypothetical protein
VRTTTIIVALAFAAGVASADPARSIHRRQLPVRLLLDGILLRAGRRTGRGRETSGRQLPEWLARIGQQLFKERRPD